jgi:hypothetical protein
VKKKSNPKPKGFLLPLPPEFEEAMKKIVDTPKEKVEEAIKEDEKKKKEQGGQS